MFLIFSEICSFLPPQNIIINKKAEKKGTYDMIAFYNILEQTKL